MFFISSNVMTVTRYRTTLGNHFFFFTDCYNRIRTGYKHYTYRDYKNVRSPLACADQCRITSYCTTFSFRSVQI